MFIHRFLLDLHVYFGTVLLVLDTLSIGVALVVVGGVATIVLETVFFGYGAGAILTHVGLVRRTYVGVLGTEVV